MIFPVARIVMLPPPIPLAPLAVMEALMVRSPITFNNTLVPVAELMGTSMTRPVAPASTVTNTLPVPARAVRVWAAASILLPAAPIAFPAFNMRSEVTRSMSSMPPSSAGLSPSTILPATALIVIREPSANTVSSVMSRPARNVTSAPLLLVITVLTVVLWDIRMSMPASTLTRLPAAYEDRAISAFCNTLAPASTVILPVPLTTSELIVMEPVLLTV